MDSIAFDARSGRFNLSGNWVVNTGEGIVKAIESHLPSLAGDELTLDFSKAGFIDSSGISDLIQLNMSLRPSGKRIVITGASPEVRRVFTICKLERIVTLRD